MDLRFKYIKKESQKLKDTPFWMLLQDDGGHNPIKIAEPRFWISGVGLFIALSLAAYIIANHILAPTKVPIIAAASIFLFVLFWVLLLWRVAISLFSYLLGFGNRTRIKTYHWMPIVFLSMRPFVSSTETSFSNISIRILSFGGNVKKDVVWQICESAYVFYNMRNVSAWLLFLIKISGEYILINLAFVLFFIERYASNCLNPMTVGVEYIPIISLSVSICTIANLLFHQYRVSSLIEDLSRLRLDYIVNVMGIGYRNEDFIDELKNRSNQLDKSSIYIIVVQMIVSAGLVYMQISMGKDIPIYQDIMNIIKGFFAK